MYVIYYTLYRSCRFLVCKFAGFYILDIIKELVFIIISVSYSVDNDVRVSDNLDKSKFKHSVGSLSLFVSIICFIVIVSHSLIKALVYSSVSNRFCIALDIK